MNSKQIRKRIEKAYSKLLSNDSYLFEVDVNERSLTHKLAEYLQLEFSEWNVDCEYNRDGTNIKKINLFKQDITSDNTDAVSVYPDIIIHHRGTNDNWVVIEAKKTSFQGEDIDKEKLETYKKHLDYKFAYKITFPTNKDENDLQTINISKCIEQI